MKAARIMADPQKDYDDYLDTLENLEVKPNPYKTKSDDDLEQLYIEVMSGTSNLSVKNRQFIVDEADRRAQL